MFIFRVRTSRHKNRDHIINASHKARIRWFFYATQEHMLLFIKLFGKVRRRWPMVAAAIGPDDQRGIIVQQHYRNFLNMLLLFTPFAFTVYLNFYSILLSFFTQQFEYKFLLHKICCRCQRCCVPKNHKYSFFLMLC